MVDLFVFDNFNNQFELIDRKLTLNLILQNVTVFFLKLISYFVFDRLDNKFEFLDPKSCRESSPAPCVLAGFFGQFRVVRAQSKGNRYKC